MENNFKKEIAIFGGGCFWCTEAVFKMLRGVNLVLPGYSGCKEEIENPNYEEICNGKTGCAEGIYIEYDSNKVSYNNLLTVFFATHDPTSLNRQGNDIGEQYRSVIFYNDLEQKKQAQEFIKKLNNSNKNGKSIVTEVEQFTKFYEAGDYHKNYYERNSNQVYCQIVINPKLEKVQKDFKNLLNNN